MKEHKFTRKRDKIFDHTTSNQTKYDSISKAKKASRQLQMSTDGGLGLGCLKVDK